MVNAGMLTHHSAIGGDNLTLRFRPCDSLLLRITIDKPCVIAVGNETDFLAIGLGGGGNAQLASQSPHLRLLHTAQRKPRARQLILLETAEEIGLVLGAIHAAAQLPAA